MNYLIYEMKAFQADFTLLLLALVSSLSTESSISASFFPCVAFRPLFCTSGAVGLSGDGKVLGLSSPDVNTHMNNEGSIIGNQSKNNIDTNHAHLA